LKQEFVIVDQAVHELLTIGEMSRFELLFQCGDFLDELSLSGQFFIIQSFQLLLALGI
jgi:hypothetical protein